MKKCSEIHEGLPQKEIRDFLSIQLVLTHEADMKNQRPITNHIDFPDTWEWSKADARGQISYLETYIQIINNRQAILKLIEINGWEEYDVSDDVHNDSGYKLGMSFIGTEKEYTILYKQIYPKNDE